MSIFNIFKKKVREPYKPINRSDSDFVKRQVEYYQEIKFDIGIALLRKVKPNCPAMAIHDMKVECMERVLK